MKKKNKNGPKIWTPHQGRNADDKYAYEKMLNIICHQGIAN